MKKLDVAINKILKLGGDRVIFIILYGSRAEGYARRDSDYDIAVYYRGNKQERHKFVMNVLAELGDEFDVKIFQDLPLILQSKILSCGKILYVKDKNMLFKIANNVRKEYEDFKFRLDLILR